LTSCQQSLQLAETIETEVSIPPGFRVEYLANGADEGSVPEDDGLYEEGETIVVAGNAGTLRKSAHTFAGWNTRPDGSGTAYSRGDEVSMPSGGLVLHAQWNPTASVSVDFADPDDPVVTFNMADGDVVDQRQQGLLDVALAEAERFSHFAWFVDGDSEHSAIQSQDAGRLTIDTYALSFGTHTITVIVDKVYSASFSFDIVDSSNLPPWVS
jgi:hypothetical protein